MDKSLWCVLDLDLPTTTPLKSLLEDLSAVVAAAFCILPDQRSNLSPAGTIMDPTQGGAMSSAEPFDFNYLGSHTKTNPWTW